MKNVLLPLLLSILIPFYSFSQTISPQWINNYFAPAMTCGVTGIEVDAAGNNYTLEFMSDTLLGPQSVTGLYLIKYNSYGQLQWVDTFTVYNFPYATRLRMDKAGNVYIGHVDSSAFLITKVRPGGDIAWRRHFSFPDPAGMLSQIALDDSANIYMAGYSLNSEVAMIAKSDSSGTSQWTVEYDYITGGYDRGNAIAPDNNGNVYVAISSMDSALQYGYAVNRYSSGGQLIWQRRYQGFNTQIPILIRAFGNNSVIVTGYCDSIQGHGDYLTQKYDSTGTLIWSAKFNVDSVLGNAFNRPDVPTDMIVTRTGNIAIVGECANNGMPILMNIMYNQQGNLVWVHKVFSTSFGRRVIEDPAGHLVFTADATDTLGYQYGIGIAKYDTLGHLLWKTNYISSPQDYYRSVCVGVDSAGNIYCSSERWDPNGIVVTTLKYDYTVDVGDMPDAGTNLLVYPSPASDRVVFKFNEAGPDRTVLIFDPLGRVIWRKKSQDSEIVFPTSGFAPGIYVYRVENANGTITGRMIIQ